MSHVFYERFPLNALLLTVRLLLFRSSYDVHLLSLLICFPAKRSYMLYMSCTHLPLHIYNILLCTRSLASSLFLAEGSDSDWIDFDDVTFKIPNFVSPN